MEMYENHTSEMVVQLKKMTSIDFSRLFELIYQECHIQW